MVCVRVAFHENDGNHENGENITFGLNTEHWEEWDPIARGAHARNPQNPYNINKSNMFNNKKLAFELFHFCFQTSGLDIKQFFNLFL